MMHPDRAFWLAKANAVAKAPMSAYDIVTWNGTRRNARAELLAVYEHLACCKKRHCESLALMDAGIRECHEEF